MNKNVDHVVVVQVRLIVRTVMKTKVLDEELDDQKILNPSHVKKFNENLNRKTEFFVLAESSTAESSENKGKPTRKTQVTRRQTGRITRVRFNQRTKRKRNALFLSHKILSTSADIPYKKGGRFNSACARCALRKISSTLLLEGVTLKEISSRLCGRFPQNFKYILAAEVRKFQRIGLKSIEITSISTDKQQNLIIDFDIIVDPQYNQAIRNALRHAVVSIDVCSNIFFQHSLIDFFLCFLA